MSPVSRRIFLYWVLLLVPTLVVGAGAIILLQRERARLLEQGTYAEEARRAAVSARTRLIAENVELLVGDVQTGLLDALTEAPVDGLDAALDEWERTNPLVRTTFRATASGQLLRPSPAAAGEEARAFVRRFGDALANRPPWSVAPSLGARASAPAAIKRENDEAVERRMVASNVAQVQSARRDVQELFKSTDLASAAAPSAAASEGMRETERSRSTASDQIGQARSKASGSRYQAPTVVNEASGSAARQRSEPVVAQLKDASPARRGWWSHPVNGRVHLLGWVQPGPGTADVRGVEVETAALLSRLSASFPTEVAVNEGYALRDSAGRVMHQSGAVTRTADPALRIPLAVELLPGWDVVGYSPAAAYAGRVGSGFVGLGVLLVAIFVAAIIAGGSLLGWQARRSNEEAAQKTSFVANVSHEFKTPLTTIRLYSELLEQGRVRDEEQGRDYLRTIGRETQRMARLVNNALDFSRLEQGQKKYARETLDLRMEIGRLLDTHAPRVADAGLTLQREIGAEPIPVCADRDALEQILLNLIDNACKYAADGSEIRVAAGLLPDGGAQVKVGDRGPGVPAVHRERIFEKFQRVDDALTAEKTGAGLGLSIARQLARGLGGELRYVPREGGGSDFVLELPRRSS